MKRLIVVAGGLVVLAGMSVGWLVADDQPAAESFSTANAGGESAPRPLPPGFATASAQAAAPGFSTASAQAPAPGYAGAYATANGSADEFRRAPPRVPAFAAHYAPAYPSPYAPANASAYAPANGSAYYPPAYGTDDDDEWTDDACCEFGCRPNQWTITAGAMVLDRLGTTSGSRTLVQDFITGDVLLNSDNVGGAWGWGPKIDVIWRFKPRWDLEMLYFGTDTPSRSTSVSGLGLYVPVLSNQILFQHVTAGSGSAIRNAESSVRGWIAPRIVGLLGFRYLALLETASLDAISELGTASSTAKLANELYGFQIGAKANLWREDGPLHIHGSIKAGIYGDHISRRQTNSGMFGDSFFADSTNRVAFVGEVDLLLTYDLSEHFSLYAGSEVMWLTGVALAPDQLSAVGGPIRGDATVLYLGALAGLQAKW
jgi:hypothetical protein